MNEVAILHGAEPRKILRTVIDKKVPAAMTYSSRGKRHTAKILLANLGANRLDIRLIPRKTKSSPHKTRKSKKQKPHPSNIEANQSVSISLKYGYGKFTFETTVIGFEQPLEPLTENDPMTHPTILVMVPDRIEIVQRRNFFRVRVPGSLKVNVTMWHCWHTTRDIEAKQTAAQAPGAEWELPENYWQGKLIDISVGGMQIVMDAAQKPDFKKGQLLSLRFTPIPYEIPLMLNAKIRNILHTADEKSICLGLQITGLQSESQDQQIVHRLCNVAEHYHQINQYSTKQQDFQTTNLPR